MAKSSFYPGTDYGAGIPPVPSPAPPGSGNSAAPSSFFKGSTAYANIALGPGYVSSFNGRQGSVAPTLGDYAVAQVTGAAPLASPVFTGDPQAPTPNTGDNDTSVATTAFVNGALLANAFPVRIGQVATRSFVPRASSTSNKQMMSRSRHRASDYISSLQIAIPNWYVDVPGTHQENPLGAPATVTASVEYPEGVFTQSMFSASASGTVPNGGTLLSDITTVEIPDNAFFFIRIFFSSSVGIAYEDLGGDDAHGEALTYAASGVTDQTMSGTVAQTTAGYRFGPCAVVAKTSKPAVYMLGASNSYGVGDLYTDDSGDQGVIARSIGTAVGYIMASVRGDTTQYFISGGNTNRLALASYCTHVVCDLSRNDIGSLGRTASQAFADLQSAWALFPTKRISQLTTLPTSSSADGWSTVAGQTTSATNAQRVALNTLLRAKPSPLVDIYDVTDVVETARDSGIWKPGYTTDGVHFSALANVVVRDAGVINPAIVTAAPSAVRPTLATPRRTDNVVINGGMLVSQELVATGATLASTTSKYILDQFEAQYTHGAGTAVVASTQLAAASFPSARPGFSFGHQLKATTALSSPANGDYAKHRTKVEGYRIAHCGFGASGASYISYAFWLYSTVAGTAFARFSNSDQSRCYHIELNVSAGWNYFYGGVPGDTTGTWQTTTSVGLVFEVFSSGKSASPVAPGSWSTANTTQTTNSGNLLGSNNNLTILTGLWIAAGSRPPTQSELPNLMRPFPEELQECIRYYFKTFEYLTVPAQNVGINTGECQFPALVAGATAQRNFAQLLPRRMRISPAGAAITYNPAAANTQVRDISAAADCSATSVGTAAGTTQFRVGQTNNAATAVGNLLAVHFTLDARM